MYPQMFGKYVLERELSRGGMARVVLATLRGAGGFEKRLVVKQIRDELSFDQQFVRRFVAEAKTTVALSHPNIVPVYELGVEQGTYFLAMELVEGCSIAELVRERNADGSRRVLSPEEGAYVGMEVCRALDYAHRRMNVVHRDITPRNVMLDEEGQVKLIDFGIAAPALVAGHEILGSPGHMPPEQVEGKELGPPTDIFAVAVLLMEAWSGVAPFRRPTPEACLNAMRGPHPRPSDYDARLQPLDEVVLRAMRLDPRDRHQNASDLGRALRAFLQGTDVTDIARALGDRVQALRESLTSVPLSTDDGPARAPMPSVSDSGTKTFAAREDAFRWSTPAALDGEPLGASTRRLHDSGAALVAAAPGAVARPLDATSAPQEPPTSLTIGVPLGFEGRDEITVKTRHRRGDPRDPAMSIPTPLMVEPFGEEGVDGLPRMARVLRTAERQSVRARREADRSRTSALVVLGAVLFVVGGFALRALTAPSGASDVAAASNGSALHDASITTRATAAGEPSGAITEAPPATAHASAAVIPALSSSTSASAANTSPAKTASAGTAGTASSAASSAVAKSGRALVSLLGDPGTRVSVDGISRGPCPVRVNLEPGQHDVRFKFDPTGETRGERFSVEANERVTVRAEFTGAAPVVRIQR